MDGLRSEQRERERSEMLERTKGLWEPLRGERVFVTGGTGFVGTWLMEAFAAANAAHALGAHAVLLTRDPERVAQRTPALFRDPAITYVRGEATSFVDPPGRFAFVVHAATERSFVADVERPTGVLEPNHLATRRVLDFARAHETRRMLFTSSGAAYGKQPADTTHIAETAVCAPDTTDPRSAYGESKRFSELTSIVYARTVPFDVMIARLFAFVGPYLPLDENYAVGNFINDVLHERTIAIAGDGTPYRSYLYAADLAVWCWTILLRGRSERVYNVGSDEAIAIGELAARVAACCRPASVVSVAQTPVPGAPPSRYVPNIDRARTELGLAPWTSLDEGIRRTFAANR